MKNIKTIIAAFLLLCFATATLSAANEIRDSKVSLGEGSKTIAQALQEIERQTGYIFAVNNSTLDISSKANLPDRPMSLEDALYVLLSGTGHTYRIVNDHILIVPGRLPEPAQQQASQTQAKAPVAEQSPRTGRTANHNQPANYSSNPDSTPTTRNNQSTFGIVDRPEPAAAPVAVAPAQKSMHSKSDEVVLGTPGRFVGKDGIPARFMSPTSGERPRFALKTNAVYWATLTPNLGIEFGLGKRTTANIFAGYNPWNLRGSEDNNRKLVHFVIQPEFRYWFCERFNGHSIGANLIYGRYNIGGKDVPFLFEKQYRYEGTAIGGGISWGYHWMLSQRWGLEFSLGAGVLNLNYNYYDCGLCGDLVQSGTKLYFGPTKAGVTLVFLIK